MLNHKTIFKQKSKILLTIICIFGLAFSYSCSCRSPEKPPTGGNTITPSMSLSRDLMVVNSAGDKTTYDIAITVADADFEIADITSEVGLTKDDFTLTGGALSLTKSFDKLTDNAEKTLTLTVNYKKKSTAGADDTLSKTTDTQTFKIIKAQKMDANTIKTTINGIGDWWTTGLPTIKFGQATLSGTTFTADAIGSDNDDTGGYDTITLGKTFFGGDKLLTKLKGSMKSEPYFKDITYVENIPNGDNQVFYYNLVVSDIYELADSKFGIEIKNTKKLNDFAVNWTE